jgi:hypothetical protein
VTPPSTSPRPKATSPRLSRNATARTAAALPPGTPCPVKVKVEKGVTLYALDYLPGDQYDAAILAISKSSAAVPLSPAQPVERLQAHAADVQAKALATARDPATVEKLGQQMKASMDALHKALSVPVPAALQAFAKGTGPIAEPGRQ